MKRVKITSHFRTFVLLSILILTISPIPTSATITVIGDSDPVYSGDPAPDPWNVGGDLIIGDDDDGWMDVNEGSGVTNVVGYMGYTAGNTGTVTISDPCSYWISSSSLYVGRYGDAY